MSKKPTKPRKPKETNEESTRSSIEEALPVLRGEISTSFCNKFPVFDSENQKALKEVIKRHLPYLAGSRKLLDQLSKSIPQFYSVIWLSSEEPFLADRPDFKNLVTCRSWWLLESQTVAFEDGSILCNSDEALDKITTINDQFGVHERIYFNNDFVNGVLQFSGDKKGLDGLTMYDFLTYWSEWTDIERAECQKKFRASEVYQGQIEILSKVEELAGTI